MRSCLHTALPPGDSGFDAWVRGWEQAGAKQLGVRGDNCLNLPAAHEGTLFPSNHSSSRLVALALHRSQRLEEEQQTALAALSRQLEDITDVEELTKLVSDRVPGLTVCWGTLHLSGSFCLAAAGSR